VPSLEVERTFWQQGHRYVAGCDEVGRGAWAGPVVAGAAVLPPDDPAICGLLRAAGLRDSKRLRPEERDALLPLIQEVALTWALGQASAAEVDQLGVAAATRLAVRRALAELPVKPHALVLDAFPLPEVPLPQRALVRADDISLSVAAASVLAKVHRDRLMVALDARFPGYGFARHKGYGTSQHRAALEALGPSPLHRHTWAPVARLTRSRDDREVGAGP